MNRISILPHRIDFGHFLLLHTYVLTFSTTEIRNSRWKKKKTWYCMRWDTTPRYYQLLHKRLQKVCQKDTPPGAATTASCINWCGKDRVMVSTTKVLHTRGKRRRTLWTKVEKGELYENREKKQNKLKQRDKRRRKRGGEGKLRKGESRTREAYGMETQQSRQLLNK